MQTGVDPYKILGLAHGAGDAEIHAAYRAAVRRTHPDAGGSAQAFEAVQSAYEQLRDPAARRAREPRTSAGAAGAGGHASAGPDHGAAAAAAAADRRAASAAMEDLLEQSRRLEEQARRLAGMTARRNPDDADADPKDSVGAVLRDAGAQLREVAGEGARELRRIVRRMR
jgi:curved DNA-binding protein CbpA